MVKHQSHFHLDQAHLKNPTLQLEGEINLLIKSMNPIFQLEGEINFFAMLFITDAQRHLFQQLNAAIMDQKQLTT